MEKNQKIAVVPGSFDPITKGHIAIIEKAAELYDKVFVAVMINPNKEYMFTLEQRKLIAAACFDGRQNIEVISSDGWLWKLANSLDACAIVKGYRNDKDLEYEKEMAEFNDAHCHKAKTLLIKADEDFLDISSTAVRAYIKEGKSLEALLSQAAIETINTLK